MPHWWPASLLTGAVARGVRITDRELPLETPAAGAGLHADAATAIGPLPLVVYFHGGGWVLGNLPSYDALCSQLAAQVGAVVVSRRLPARARAPDAHRAPKMLMPQRCGWPRTPTEVGADGSRLAVAGDSAGGNLAAAVAILARDRGGPAIAHQGLFYPATDGTLSSPSLEEHARGPILTLASVRAYRALYLGPDGDERDVRMSPLLADDLTGLPPALVQTAELDPIRDDGRRYAAALVGGRQRRDASPSTPVRPTAICRSPAPSEGPGRAGRDRRPVETSSVATVLSRRSHGRRQSLRENLLNGGIRRR